MAEKLDAILSLMEFSRMKDYYDLYYLAHRFDFDGETLALAMSKTFANRGHLFTLEQFQQMMSCGSDEDMQKKWMAFVKKTDVQEENFVMVLDTINSFLNEPFEAVVHEGIFLKKWSVKFRFWQ